ncbi:hypothetical protein ACFXGI_32715 [Streptomyces sp. NPDC059355]|uniref:hypothetical protein n=1 Tax=Streptomyces sp. NPDC059355 TaxID=3346811 RepID=UPI0036B07634
MGGAFAVRSAQDAKRAERPKAEAFTFNAAVLAGDLATDARALGLTLIGLRYWAVLAAAAVAVVWLRPRRP